MRITIIKGLKDDRIEFRRGDGSEAAAHFPKKGPIPHDFVHFAVERGFGLRDGFLGKVAAGADPDAVAEMAKRGGHASAARADKPDPAIVEMVQVERLVECFEADAWSGGDDNDTLRALARAGWSQSLVPPLKLDDATITAVRRTIADFAAQWGNLTTGQRIELTW
ncbi:hypothetical protein H9L13_00480 [Sphingomonas lutea]|uniref:Uncharacterized protein n=1 Tax=Sphingomonas lutea TaxID=1045317 RepID=A0A7G9SI11_9SPHN|nr:hypothetical protein [Sphingomonas lutea]QNN67486.1 hypothetical protein H9L13_00480 [Sphingomonas lutea]